MDHNSVECPAWWSRKALSARSLSLPDFASDSICRSQTSASNCANQSRNAFNSSAESALSWSSIDSTLLIEVVSLYPEYMIDHPDRWRHRRARNGLMLMPTTYPGRHAMVDCLLLNRI